MASTERPTRRFAGVMVVNSLEDKILLGMKLRGFGAGKWQHSFAGKVEVGEDFRDCAKRELYEETSLIVDKSDLKPVGIFHYEFENPAIIDHVMEVHIFTAAKFEGCPVETPEICPSFVPFDALPLDAMWPDNSFWLPQLLAVAKDGWPPSDILCCQFVYKDKDSISYHSISRRDGSTVS